MDVPSRGTYATDEHHTNDVSFPGLCGKNICHYRLQTLSHPMQRINPFSAGNRRKIPASKVDPRTERTEQIIMAVDPEHRY